MAIGSLNKGSSTVSAIVEVAVFVCKEVSSNSALELSHSQLKHVGCLVFLTYRMLHY